MSTPDQLPHMPHSLGALLLDQVRHRGHQPLLTFYGDATGERTELSYATFDNWASKTANLLAEECDAGPSTRVALAVTSHWTGAAIVAATWKLGAIIVPAGAEAEVRVVHEEGLAADAGGGALVVVGAGMGGRVTGDVAGLAYGDEVLAFGDDYDDPGVTLDDPALVADAKTWSQAELLRTAWGTLGAQDRLLSTASLATVDGVTLGLLAPIAAGASVVWCPGMSAEDAARHAQNERATHRLAGGAVEAL
jgi:uncharacterized protein (TIGR03089 family)